MLLQRRLTQLPPRPTLPPLWLTPLPTPPRPLATLLLRRRMPPLPRLPLLPLVPLPVPPRLRLP